MGLVTGDTTYKAHPESVIVMVVASVLVMINLLEGWRTSANFGPVPSVSLKGLGIVRPLMQSIESKRSLRLYHLVVSELLTPYN